MFFFFSLEGAKFGAINALRTGNPTKDMITAMMVPLMFKAVFDGANMIPKLVDMIFVLSLRLNQLKFECKTL